MSNISRDWNRCYSAYLSNPSIRKYTDGWFDGSVNQLLSDENRLLFMRLVRRSEREISHYVRMGIMQ